MSIENSISKSTKNVLYLYYLFIRDIELDQRTCKYELESVKDEFNLTEVYNLQSL